MPAATHLQSYPLYYTFSLYRLNHPHALLLLHYTSLLGSGNQLLPFLPKTRYVVFPGLIGGMGMDYKVYRMNGFWTYCPTTMNV